MCSPPFGGQPRSPAREVRPPDVVAPVLMSPLVVLELPAAAFGSDWVAAVLEPYCPAVPMLLPLLVAPAAPELVEDDGPAE